MNSVHWFVHGVLALWAFFVTWTHWRTARAIRRHQSLMMNAPSVPRAMSRQQQRALRKAEKAMERRS